LAGAELQLAQAQAALTSLLDGPSTAETAAAEAEIEQARLSLADAQAQLAKATLTAPFAAVITAVSVTPGEIASGAVITLVDMDNLEVVLAVDEVDVGALAPGQPAVITLETWSDVAIESEILTIAPGATVTPGSALVTYDVRLGLGPTELPVRVGMTANANLITAAREDILLVPNRAVNVDRQSGTYSVNLLVGETVQEVPVAIGLRDNQFTQILEGLQAGDSLLVTNGAPVQDVLQDGPNVNGE
jgi:HlyD family secretion protein